MFIAQLKNFDEEQMDLDELIELSAAARSLRSEYEALATDVPEWLDNVTRQIRRVIKSRQADAVAKRLRELRLRQNSLRTKEELRADIAAEIKTLEQQYQET